MVISLLLIAAIRGISGVGNLDGRKFIGRTSDFRRVYRFPPTYRPHEYQCKRGIFV